MLFKDAVVLPDYSSFRILSHNTVLESIVNGSDRTVRQGTSNHIISKFLVTLSIAKNNYIEIVVGKVVNAQ